MNNFSKIIILGSGPAGLTAALYLSRANLSPTLITGNEIGGQLINTNNIENWPGEFNGITGIKLTENFLKHSKNFGTNIIKDTITKVELSGNIKKLFNNNNKEYNCNILLIATGAIPRKLNLPLEDEFTGRGISYCATCDGFFYKNKEIVIIGGGNTAIEEAIYLSNIVKKITIIHRNNSFRAEDILLKRLNIKILEKKIELKMLTRVNDIIIENDKLKGINLISEENKKYFFKTDGIFIAIGYIPNTKIFKNQLKLDRNGYIKTGFKKKGIKDIYIKSKTNIEGVFVAGDVQDPIYKQAITSASSGCIAAIDIQNYLNKLK